MTDMKAIINSFLIFILIVVGYLVLREKFINKSKDNNYMTIYTKNIKRKNKRSISSVKSFSIDSNNFNNREIVGENLGKISSKKLPLINYVSSQWVNKLTWQLIRSQVSGINVMVDHKKELILVRKGQGRYVEKVLVTYKNKEGKKISSFNALVDSQTGTIIRSWNRTIHERKNRFFLEL